MKRFILPLIAMILAAAQLTAQGKNGQLKKVEELVASENYAEAKKRIDGLLLDKDDPFYKKATYWRGKVYAAIAATDGEAMRTYV